MFIFFFFENRSENMLNKLTEASQNEENQLGLDFIYLL